VVKEQPTRKVVRQLRDAGFRAVRTQGSHTVYQKGALSVTVPDGHRTVSPGVYRKVLRAIEESTS